AVGVVGNLLSKDTKVSFIEDIRAEYAKAAAAHERAESEKRRIPLAQARANSFKPGWDNYTPPQPSFLGTRVFDNFDLAELAGFIDWTPFFQTWELKGRYPAILEDERQGEAARSLFADAQKMLGQIIDEKW